MPLLFDESATVADNANFKQQKLYYGQKNIL